MKKIGADDEQVSAVQMQRSTFLELKLIEVGEDVFVRGHFHVAEEMFLLAIGVPTC